MLPNTVTIIRTVHEREVPTALQILLIARQSLRFRLKTRSTSSSSPKQTFMTYLMQFVCLLSSQKNSKPLKTASTLLPSTHATKVRRILLLSLCRWLTQVLEKTEPQLLRQTLRPSAHARTLPSGSECKWPMQHYS